MADFAAATATERVARHGPQWNGHRCSGRCWFAYYGWVGSSSPWCVKCGRPNPNYRPDDDPMEPADDG